MNWRCISVVNPNNNLRSLKRSLSATLLFCRNINVNVMHTIVSFMKDFFGDPNGKNDGC